MCQHALLLFSSSPSLVLFHVYTLVSAVFCAQCDLHHPIRQSVRFAKAVRHRRGSRPSASCSARSSRFARLSGARHRQRLAALTRALPHFLRNRNECWFVSAPPLILPYLESRLLTAHAADRRGGTRGSRITRGSRDSPLPGLQYRVYFSGQSAASNGRELLLIASLQHFPASAVRFRTVPYIPSYSYALLFFSLLPGFLFLRKNSEFEEPVAWKRTFFGLTVSSLCVIVLFH